MDAAQKQNNMKTKPFKMKGFSGFGNSPAKDKIFDKKQEADKALEDKKKRAIMQGKIANWNKKNPNATQEEMNAYIASLKIEDIKLPASPTRKMEPKEGAVGANMYAKLTKKKKEPKFNFTGTGKFKFNKRFNFTGGQDDSRYRGNYDEID